MTEHRFTESLLFKALCVTLLLTLTFFLLIYFKDLFKPLALGILFWYLIKAFHGMMEKITFRKKPLNPWVRRIVAMVAILAIGEITIQILASNIRALINNYPAYQATFGNMVEDVGHQLGLNNFGTEITDRLGELNIRGFLTGVLSSLSSMVGNLFLVIIYTIFLLLEEHSFSQKIHLIFHSSGRVHQIRQVIDQIYSSTNKYVVVKAWVSLLIAILSYVVLLIVDVDFAFLWALLIFIFNFIPYVGSLISGLLPATFAVIQHGSIWPFIWIIGSVIVIHAIIGNYLEPKVMGKSLNLSPLVVLLSLAFWGTIWDLLGMLLAVPITSILLITLAQFPSTRAWAILLTENGDIESLIVKNPSSKE
jgi:predicted PurR-regulated permease PerM